jgi:hypothetical protein
MKTPRALLTIAGIVLLGFPVASQTENQKAAASIDFANLGLYLPGILYYKNGNVEKGDRIEYQNPEMLKKLDNVLNYYDWRDPKTQVSVNQAELEAFEIAGNKWIRITHNGEEQFGIIHLDGAIKDYSVFKIPVVRVTGDYIEQRYIRKLDQEPISSGAFMLKFKKYILEMVGDDTELVNKINAKEKGYKAFLDSNNIVTEYNAWYKRQYPGSGN